MTAAMKWHKRYQRSYTENTRHLDLETRGAYQDCLDYIYEYETPIPLDDRFMAHFMHVSERKWIAVREKLVADGKLIKVENGYINPRAETELASRKEARSNKSEAAQKRWADVGEKLVPRETQPRLNDGSTDFHGCETSTAGEKHNGINETVVENEYKRHVEIELDKESKPPTPCQGEASEPAKPNCKLDALQAFQAWNETALRCALPQAAKLTPDRTRRIIARLRDYGLDGWMRALANVEKSNFLTGGTDTGFRADLDFVCQAKSFGKLHDGGYGNGRHARAVPGAVPSADELRPAFEKWAQVYAEQRKWGENPLLGTPPGTPGCLVPADILAKYGLPQAQGVH